MNVCSDSRYRRELAEVGISTNGQPVDEQTPDEAIESAHEDIRAALADDVLEQVMNSSPTLFERLVLDLLIAMGYDGPCLMLELIMGGPATVESTELSMETSLV